MTNKTIGNEQREGMDMTTLGSFDWSGDRLDRTIEKLQARCDFKRLELVAAG